MAVATSAVSFLVDKLREELSKDIILLRGARAQMEWMETEFRRMGCFLKDADGMEEESEVTKNRTQEVRDLAYRAEEAIDVFFLRIAYAREAEGCWGQLKRYVFILNEVAACREVASEVEWMKQRLRSISESQGVYSFAFKIRGGPSEERRISSSQYDPLHGSGGGGGADDEKLLDFGQKLPEWVKMLTTTAADQERKVLSLVGAAGLGKSAVAHMLSNDDSVKGHFGLRAWVSVSPQWSPESIYNSLGRELHLTRKRDDMMAEVVKVLREGRYLIVVDDVWDNEAWDFLANLFPDPENGSRIILTTRNADVGSHAAGASGRCELLQPLRERLIGFKRSSWVEQLMAVADRERRVLCIVGAAGLGKSAVANELYNDDRVKGHFNLRAWVFVSAQWSPESIFDSLGPQVGLTRKRDDRAAEVVKVLIERRYLIVVDDVWDNKAWDFLAKLFPDPKNGSRIILTTRNADVGSHANGATGWCQHLQPLSEPQGLTLFEKKANMREMDPSRRANLTPLAQEIVRKCEGVPLAIVSMAVVLARKAEDSAWERASKSVGYLLTEGEKRTSWILHLSYRYLPYQLKPCFLYLAGFPEEVRARKLIRMWAAEGLLEKRGEESLEDVGEDCLQELVQRSLVRVVETSSTGGIKSCRIQSLLQHVALLEAKTNNFLKVHHHPQNSAATVSRFLTKARRLAIHGSSSSGGASTDDQEEEEDEDEDEDISISGASRDLRSVLIYPKKGKEEVGKKLLGSVFGEYKWLNWVFGEYKWLNWLLGEYKLLRVLDLQKAKIKEVPSQIGHLVHLRYLALAFAIEQRSGDGGGFNQAPTPITLPGSIDKLHSLQTLECYYPYGIRIPSGCSIEKMQALRHVLLKSPNGFECPTIGTSLILENEQGSSSKAVRIFLRNLHTLTNVFAGEWLKNCRRLRKLGITIDPDNFKYCEYAANLVSLRSLSISVQAEASATATSRRPDDRQPAQVTRTATSPGQYDLQQPQARLTAASPSQRDSQQAQASPTTTSPGQHDPNKAQATTIVTSPSGHDPQQAQARPTTTSLSQHGPHQAQAGPTATSSSQHNQQQAQARTTATSSHQHDLQQAQASMTAISPSQHHLQQSQARMIATSGSPHDLQQAQDRTITTSPRHYNPQQDQARPIATSPCPHDQQQAQANTTATSSSQFDPQQTQARTTAISPSQHDMQPAQTRIIVTSPSQHDRKQAQARPTATSPSPHDPEQAQANTPTTSPDQNNLQQAQAITSTAGPNQNSLQQAQASTTATSPGHHDPQQAQARMTAITPSQHDTQPAQARITVTSPSQHYRQQAQARPTATSPSPYELQQAQANILTTGPDQHNLQHVEAITSIAGQASTTSTSPGHHDLQQAQANNTATSSSQLDQQKAQARTTAKSPSQQDMQQAQARMIITSPSQHNLQQAEAILTATSRSQHDPHQPQANTTKTSPEQNELQQAQASTTTTSPGHHDQQQAEANTTAISSSQLDPPKDQASTTAISPSQHDMQQAQANLTVTSPSQANTPTTTSPNQNSLQQAQSSTTATSLSQDNQQQTQLARPQQAPARTSPNKAQAKVAAP